MYIYNGIYNIYMDQLKWNIQYLYGSMGISICIYIYIKIWYFLKTYDAC